MNPRTTLLAGATALVVAVLSSSPALAAGAAATPAPTASPAASPAGTVSPAGTEIASHYRSMGGSASLLGTPVGGVVAVGRGALQAYTHGTIFWSQATGAWSVHGAILDRYRAAGGPTGPLGFPVDDETGTPDHIGRYNHFSAGASVYWSPETGAHAVRGAIRSRWAALGWENGPMGYPAGEEQDTADGRGRVSTFAGHGGPASITWSPGTGAHGVYGAIKLRWDLAGGVRGVLGYPTSDEYATGTGRRSDFQGGATLYDAGTGRTSLLLPAGAPTGLQAQAGDRSAALRFGAPSEANGLVLGYEISLDGRTWTRLITTPGPAGSRTAAVPGLDNGRTYTIGLRAVNLLGAGASATVQVTPRPAQSPPAAVRDLRAVPGDGSVELSFSQPADGGSPITTYEYSSDGGATWQPLGWMSDGTTVSATVRELVNGQSYSFVVRVGNAFGSGPASAVATAVPAALPAAVTGLQTRVGDGVVHLTFPPAEAAGTPVTGYEYRLDGGEWTALDVDDAEGALAGDVGGLTDGQAYSLEVRALTSAGAGPAGDATLVQPAGVPAQITDLTAVAHDGSVRLSYSWPSGRGSDVTALEVSLDGGGTWQEVSNYTPGSPFTTDLWSLANGTSYDIRLRAVNALGAAPGSDQVTVVPVGLPGTVTGLTTTLLGPIAELSFPAADGNGSATVRYEYRTDGGDWLPLTVVAPVESGPLTADLLWPSGAPGSVEVRAVNEVGAGTPSAVTGVGQQAPAQVTGVVAARGPIDAHFTFPVPAAGTSPITSYEYSQDGGPWTPFVSVQVGPQSVFAMVFDPSLLGQSNRSYRIRAVSADGAGAASAPVSVTGWF